MGLIQLFVLAYLSISAVAAAADPDEDVNPVSPNLKVGIKTSFPAAEVFGVKLMNGVDTEAHLSITNDEPEPIQIAFVGGSLYTQDLDKPSKIARNLTAAKVDLKIPPGENESILYKFRTEMHPQDLRLQLWAAIKDSNENLLQLVAFNETVSVVERPTSFFDPQIIFLYVILMVLFAGASYFIYNTWISTLFPQQPKRRTGKSTTRPPKKVEPAEAVTTAMSDGPATSIGSKGYDESWIPDHHIKRPDAKRIRSGTPSGVKTKKAA